MSKARLVPLSSTLSLVLVLLGLWDESHGQTHPSEPASTLPLQGTRIVRVANEAALQSAIHQLQDGDTVLLADGTYALTRSLFIQGKNNITIRGTTGSTNVILTGRGMDNRDYGDVRFGIWSNGTNTTIAHLTLRDTYDNLIIFNAGAQSPHIYSVHLVNAGSQFIKANPTDVPKGIGVDNGVVEFCLFAYTGAPPNDHGSGVGYFNGISAHAARNWIVRGNLFQNLHNPDHAAYLWNAAVLFWRHSSGTLTERNIFLNTDRAVAYGLEDGKPYPDHAGGIIRNNFVWLAPERMSASRRANSDGTIIAWNSPGTRIDHNTVVVNDNLHYSIEFRFPGTTNGWARNNLTDAPLHRRDQAVVVESGNVTGASAAWFVDAAKGDLHLRPSAEHIIDQARVLDEVNFDIDGEARPLGAGCEVGADEVRVTGQR